MLFPTTLSLNHEESSNEMASIRAQYQYNMHNCIIIDGRNNNFTAAHINLNILCMPHNVTTYKRKLVLTVLRKLPLIWNAAAAGTIVGKPFDSVCIFSVEFKCLVIRSIFRFGILFNSMQNSISISNHACLDCLIQLDANVTSTPVH